jgi:glycosyltransferase involved in cell wall biosynthesis
MKNIASNIPEVSICCITYNHEEFIQQTLESFLNQETSFNYEILIGEDHSTDQTRCVIERFMSLHPGRIVLLPKLDINLGMKRNSARALSACKGAYIAICDGDDYWIDKHKLQKQWEFLESHTDFVISYANVQAHNSEGIDYTYSGGSKFNLTQEQLIGTEGINTLTTMFRNVLGDLPPEHQQCGTPDLFLWSLLGHHGRGYYDASILPSIYRIHGNGVHSQKSNVDRLIDRLMTFYSLFMYYRRIGDNSSEMALLKRAKLDISQIKSQSKQALEKLENVPVLMDLKYNDYQEFMRLI